MHAAAPQSNTVQHKQALATLTVAVDLAVRDLQAALSALLEWEGSVSQFADRPDDYPTLVKARQHSVWLRSLVAAYRLFL